MASSDSIQSRDIEALARTSGEMTFADVIVSLRSRWWLPTVTMLTFLAGALLYDFLATPLYKAQTVLAPAAETQSSGGLSGIASDLSGLASLAGLSLGSLSGSQTQTQVAIATLQSRVLIEQYIVENNLMPVLFASKWDAARKRWKSESASDQPTLWDASELFLNKIEEVDYDRLTGLVTLTVKWKSPALAAQWANGLVTMTNARLRKIAIAQTATNIRYLERKEKETTDVEMNSAISQLLEGQLNEEMLAQGNEQYAFNVIDPAVPPGKPEWPKKVLLALGGAFAGLLFGVLMTLVPRDKRRGSVREA